MQGVKVVFASFAAVGLLAAGVLGGIVVAPRVMPSAQSAVFTDGAFEGIAALRFDDPAGDATDVGIGDAGTYAGCLVGAFLNEECMDPLPAPSSPRGAPHFDILAVGLEETADDVVFTLEIAQLDEGFPQLAMPGALHRMSYYGVCWYATDDDYCSRAAYLDVMSHDGMLHLTTTFDAYVEDCNEWWWCSWTIPTEVRYGAPGAIVFRVPKAYAAIDGEPLRVHHLDGWTGWTDQATAFPMWHGGATLSTPLRHVHDHVTAPGVFGVGDMTPELDAQVDLAPPVSPPALALDMPLSSGHAGATHAHGSEYEKPELDLAGFDLYEENGELVVVFALAQAVAHPTYDFDYSVALGIQAAEVLEIGYRQEMGEAVGYAGECIMEECQDGHRFEVPAEFVPGAPAFVLVRVPADVLAELTDARPGDQTTLFWASSMYTEGSRYFGEYDEPVYGDVHNAFMVDSLTGGAPYVFGSGHRGAAEHYAMDGHGAH